MPSLIVRLPNHLGDACMALPALGLLARGGFDLTLPGKPWARDLFAAYPWPAIALPSSRLARVRTLRDWRSVHRGAQALLLTNSFATALEFRLAGLRPIGYATDARGWLLDQAVDLPQPLSQVHMVEYYYRIAATIVRDAPAVPADLALRVSDDAVARASSMLTAAKVASPYIVVCPVAVGQHRGHVKAWNGFARLCDGLLARGERVVACPGPGEHDAVMRAVPNAVVLPQTDVGTFSALLAGSRLVVANDSGPGHLAAAVGAQLVSVFGVTEPTRTRPWGKAVTIVGSENGWPIYDEVLAAVETRLAG